MDINRGDILRQVLEKYREDTGTSMSKIAKAAGYDNSMPYRHFKQPYLPTYIIHKYGKAIAYDFSKDIPEMAKDYQVVGPVAPKELTTIDECRSELEQLRIKYMDLLERHNSMLRAQLSS